MRQHTDVLSRSMHSGTQENVLPRDIHGRLGDFNEMQGKLRARTILYFDPALDIVVK